MWQGDDDRLVPIQLQRIIAQKLTWIKYHEIPGAGHIFPMADGMAETILKELLPIPQSS
jgi:pimeloyl-ACP methyl ester carboxylesterase